jgi:hypothetical protein
MAITNIVINEQRSRLKVQQNPESSVTRWRLIQQ